MTLRILFISFFAIALSTVGFGATLYSRADGTWSNTNGGADCLCLPGSNDNIFVNHDIAIAGTFTLKGDLIIDNGATLTINGTGDFTVDAGGSLRIINGSIMTINDDAEFKNNSIVIIESGAQLNVIGDMTNRNNSDNITFNGAVSVGGNLDNGNNGVIDGSGSLQVTGTVTNNGTIGGSTGNDVGSLPVEILYFRHVLENNVVLLQWATEWEENFAYFTIERSTDGKTFDAVGTRDGAGAPTLGQAYSWKDNTPYAGKAYYRLKATDWDGFEEYHGTIVVESWATARSFKAYPSPTTTGQFQIATNFDLGSSSNLQVISLQGQVVWQTNAHSGQTHFTLPQHLPNGSYLLILQSEQTTLKQSIQIAR